jgi:lincosamide nucleotidyltransferase A/C/D/E
VNAEQVAELFVHLDERGLRSWVGGGWGVDALVGRTTRSHADLDLAVDADQLEDVLSLLRGLGFAEAVDWLPSRVELAAPDGRRVDVHPVTFDHDGSALQAGHGGPPFRYPADAFTWGVIGGVRVPCLTAVQQLVFRTGYPLRNRDRHDIPLLLALLLPGEAARWRYDGAGRLSPPAPGTAEEERYPARALPTGSRPPESGAWRGRRP